MAVAGKVAITPKGEWNANTTYEKLDLVFFENASYVAIKPSTGVSPTDESFWMLVVQSAGGADLEAIISGTQQVGNAKTLDGHEAEYFLPKSGGTVDGSIFIQSNEAVDMALSVANSLKRAGLRVYSNGVVDLYDYTNAKNILRSDANGTNTFNGTANGNLPLTGGTVENITLTPLTINRSNASASQVALRFKLAGTTLAHIAAKSNGDLHILGANEADVGKLLHTGNKPSGTYTGNGDATKRTVNVGGIGNVLRVAPSGHSLIVYPDGAIGTDQNGNVVTFKASEIKFYNGTLTIASSGIVNTSGASIPYEML